MEELRNNLCSRFCSFYKPGKSGEPACLGFLVIADLISCGEIELPLPERIDRDAGGPEEICPHCPFVVDGCDFAVKIEGAPPCGGLVALKALLRSGLISRSEVAASAMKCGKK